MSRRASEARERDRASSDQLAREAVAADRVIAEAIDAARLLPPPLGDAIRALFAAMLPFRAGDGHLSFPVLGRRSPEMLALARAVTDVATAGRPERRATTL